MKKAAVGTLLVATWLQLSATSAAADVEGDSSGEATPAPLEVADLARERFVAGTRLAREGDWLGALTAYQGAYQLYPHATTLYNIGYCQMRLGELVAAWQSTARALDSEAHEPGRQMGPARRAIAERQRQDLRQRLATLVVGGPPGLLVQVDDRSLLPALLEPGGFVLSSNDTGSASMLAGQTPIYVNPGQHTIVLAVGEERQRRVVALAEGSLLTVEWSPTSKPSSPPNAMPRPATTAALAAPGAGPTASAGHDAGAATLVGAAKVGSIAVGAAGFGLALASGIVAWSTDSHLASACPAPRACPASEQEAVERYRHAVTLTNVGLITGLTGSAVALGFVLFGDDERKPSTSLSATVGGVKLLHAF